MCEQIIDYLNNGNIRNAVNVPSIDAETLAQIKPNITLGEDLGSFILNSLMVLSYVLRLNTMVRFLLYRLNLLPMLF